MNTKLGNIAMARILIVDDSPTMRQAITIIVENEQDLNVCGEACCIADALEQCEALQPDLALIDISLKGEDGLDLVRRLRECAPSVYTIVFSLHGEPRYIAQAREAGAHGYARKDEGPGELLACMRDALNGNSSFSRPEQP